MGGRKYKVLVVDDEPEVEPMFRQRMRPEISGGRYEFVFARSGLEALEVLETLPDIDMVITDINMPGMDGLELLGQLNEDKPDMMSVILSAYGDMANIRAAMNLGAFDFITKPVDFADLKVTMERTLRQMEQLREALASRDRLVSLEKELYLASQMQQLIVPDVFPCNGDFEVFGRMRAARNVGGDFFDVMWLDERRVCLVVADVAGKGVPAALMMMSCRTLLRGVAATLDDPAEVLEAVNGMLCEGNRLNMFVTVFYAVYEIDTGRLWYANGGHNAPVLVRGGEAEELESTGDLVLGVLQSHEFSSREVRLEAGDRVFMFTDGVTESEDGAGEPFGVSRLCEVLLGGSMETVEGLVARVFVEVDGFSGDGAQFDDITCLCLERKG